MEILLKGEPKESKDCNKSNKQFEKQIIDTIDDIWSFG